MVAATIEVLMSASTRKMIDCRRMPPSDRNCTLTIAGTEDEVMMIAVRHAVEEHGHTDTPELRQMLRSGLVDEPTEVHA
jgi:predicted small metal-binding protein